MLSLHVPILTFVLLILHWYNYCNYKVIFYNVNISTIYFHYNYYYSNYQIDFVIIIICTSVLLRASSSPLLLMDIFT